MRVADMRQRRSGDHYRTIIVMSAFGTKRTFLFAPHMSAFRGKADMTIRRCLLLRSLLGVKRTSLCAAQMSANDPKRTLAGPFPAQV